MFINKVYHEIKALLLVEFPFPIVDLKNINNGFISHIDL
jgi:hypothetical protein